jgi:tetraacyldisaccharide 4'-kinase
MWQSLHDAWWRLATQQHPHAFSDALACQALHAGSVAYGAAVALRNAAYDRDWRRPVRLPCRVVSVGNLTVGGAGKTTCVELITRKLAAQGRRVAILSRGYGGSRRDDYWLRGKAGRLLVNDRDETAADPWRLRGLADEAQMLAAHLEGVPVVVGPRRDRTGSLACRQLGCDTVVLDDGFQHRRLHRDCDIVLVQARMPLGGWALLPRGPMREPLASLARADVVILTKADEALPMVAALRERLRVFAPQAIFATAAHVPSRLLEGLTGSIQGPSRLAGLRVGLVSSIGDPAGFEATVRGLQATVRWHLAFPDHHPYREADWRTVLERAGAEPIEAFVTTEKDWVRLRPLAAAQPPARTLWVLGVGMTLLEGSEDVDARLAGLPAR